MANVIERPTLEAEREFKFGIAHASQANMMLQSIADFGRGKPTTVRPDPWQVIGVMSVEPLAIQRITAGLTKLSLGRVVTPKVPASVASEGA